MRLHRHPKNRAFLDRCIRIAQEHPDWSIAKVEARATIEALQNGNPQMKNTIKDCSWG